MKIKIETNLTKKQFFEAIETLQKHFNNPKLVIEYEFVE